MSLTSFKLLIFVTFLVIIVESRPKRQIKECNEDKECASGFSCMFAKKYGKRICAKLKSSNKEKKHSQNQDYNLPGRLKPYNLCF